MRSQGSLQQGVRMAFVIQADSVSTHAEVGQAAAALLKPQRHRSLDAHAAATSMDAAVTAQAVIEI